MSAAEVFAAVHFAQGVARLLAPPGAEDDAVRYLRAEDLPDLLTHLRERLAQARAEGEAAGRAAERSLGDHDARNVLWLSGRSIKQTNITSPAGRRALERFNSLPRHGWSETPQRIDALVVVVRESHEIHSEWHGRLISQDEAEAYVRGEHVGAAGGAR